MNFNRFIEQRSVLFWRWTASILVGVFGVLDFLTGYELSFSLLYVAPIAVATWYVDVQFGLVISVASGIAWMTADILSGHYSADPLVYLWNTLIRFGFFVIIAQLMGKVRQSYDREREHAQRDFISGAFNARYFYTIAAVELGRSRRYLHPFTVAYLDLDNFKAVNDRYGHSEGDKVLQSVAASIQSNLRNIDTVSRLGGDEFVLLLPETGEAAAQVVIKRVRARLMEEMQLHGWPVSVSIGVVTCLGTCDTVDGIIHAADEMMYSIKANGKNGIGFTVRAGKDMEATAAA